MLTKRFFVRIRPCSRLPPGNEKFLQGFLSPYRSTDCGNQFPLANQPHKKFL
jgi:hypothetical protein